MVSIQPPRCHVRTYFLVAVSTQTHVPWSLPSPKMMPPCAIVPSGLKVTVAPLNHFHTPTIGLSSAACDGAGPGAGVFGFGYGARCGTVSA